MQQSLARAQAPVQAFADDEARWAALVARDAAADGVFYYGVRTTGVYCRPSCASRRANRENVSFHASCAAAERAGFRPCKRCRPNAAGLAERRAAAVAEACRLIGASEELPALDALAQAAGLSRFHFHRVFKEATGMTPYAYGRAQRARRVRRELAQAPTVTEAIYNAGFNSSGRFYADAETWLGMSPAAFRAGGEGAEIRYACGRCSLGLVLAAATAKGVCAILLGDAADTLAAELANRFPAARIAPADREFEQLLAAVVALVEDPARGLALPLDVRGTAFQHSVWQALRDIPPGTTASYSEIAARLGRPGAARAVAQACAANKIALAIPCHRVVRNDGDLSGYRWGTDRKRALLDRERGS
ncbi:MAG: bifunctional DNA-binding transcriptional regulator/O6-methylguanine-DNA methyltransferase Ada [Gammaproteobacteria bacterium]|nr:bifunctional DNA-binding transcriptional regulator/O6-methylguanine-DNA methyltransferase Ada [Gammaproteobacteria bacterium]